VLDALPHTQQLNSGLLYAAPIVQVKFAVAAPFAHHPSEAYPSQVIPVAIHSGS
jgi:hypothetical protein